MTDIPTAETGAKVWVLAKKNGNKLEIVAVFNSRGLAQITMTELNAAQGMNLHWIEETCVVGGPHAAC